MARASKANTRIPTKEELELCALAKEIGNEVMSETLRIQRTVFDLDSKGDVTVIKDVEFSPVASMQEALAKVNHDGAKMLAIVNAGLRDYTREQAETDGTPWMQEDEEGNKSEFSGTLLSEEKSKQLAVNALNMAKLLFGYTKEGEKAAKREAKAKAMDMLLSNPAVVEALKS